jgi:glucans biosynthesis protein
MPLLLLPPALRQTLRSWREGRRERIASGVTGALIALSVFAFLALSSLPAPAAAAVIDDVAAKAQALAARAYVAPRPATPRPANPAASAADPNGAMSYDQYRDIRFREERALWHDAALPFQVMFFHPGFVHTETVVIHDVSPAGANPAAPPADRVLGFDTRLFDYGHNAPPDVTFDGFAGFRVVYPLNRGDRRDEVVAFLGASYFRALGAGARYGLSARGLAVDTVGGAGPEEFPRFTEFWLERPAPGARALVIDALLDSPSVAGAYRFTVTPGAETRIDVEARLFARRTISTFGVAPLTSMFLSGENQPRPEDFRPKVHDSDGLMVAAGSGEWLWRPLGNPPHPFTTSFLMERVIGFGLMQRDRRFASYEDVEARYDLRPSAWIEPKGDWGPGRVELFQLPTPDETNDNVVAYWVPAQPLVPGTPRTLGWTIRWQGNEPQRPPGAWVTQTRVGRSFAHLGADERQFVLDFEGPALSTLAADAEVKAVATADANGQVLEAIAYPNEATGGWRLALRVRQLRADQPLELRAFLRHGADVLGETWSHVIPPR